MEGCCQIGFMFSSPIVKRLFFFLNALIFIYNNKLNSLNTSNFIVIRPIFPTWHNRLIKIIQLSMQQKTNCYFCPLPWKWRKTEGAAQIKNMSLCGQTGCGHLTDLFNLWINFYMHFFCNYSKKTPNSWSTRPKLYLILEVKTPNLATLSKNERHLLTRWCNAALLYRAMEVNCVEGMWQTERRCNTQITDREYPQFWL